MKKTLFLILTVTSIFVFSQTKNSSLNIELNTGVSYLVRKIYFTDKGVATPVILNLYYNKKYVGLGVNLDYSFVFYKDSNTENLNTFSISPFIAFIPINNKKYSLSLNIGYGWYNDFMEFKYPVLKYPKYYSYFFSLSNNIKINNKIGVLINGKFANYYKSETIYYDGKNEKNTFTDRCNTTTKFSLEIGIRYTFGKANKSETTK